MMGEFSVVHWVVVLAVVGLIFGPSRLPALGAGLGEAIKNFKGAFKELTNFDEDVK
jgi:sec-independent protein translocase protein TatA